MEIQMEAGKRLRIEARIRTQMGGSVRRKILRETKGGRTQEMSLGSRILSRTEGQVDVVTDACAVGTQQ